MISTATAAVNAVATEAPVPSQNPSVDHRQCHDDRHEYRRYPVRETLRRRLSVLRVLDQSSYLRQLGVGANAAGLHYQSAIDVDGRADNLVAGGYFDRDRLAGEHRRVDCRISLDDDPVGGDLLAGPDHELVADAQHLDRNTLFTPSLRTETSFAPISRAPGGRRRPPPGAGFEVSAGQDERRHPGCCFEIDVAGAVGSGDGQLEWVRHSGRSCGTPEQRIDRPAQRGKSAGRNQGVHRCGPVPQVRPRRLVKRPGAPHHNRRGQGQGQPLPVRELQRRRHRHRDYRNRQRKADQQALPQRACRVADGFVGHWTGLRQPRPVAGFLDGRHELFRG